MSKYTKAILLCSVLHTELKGILRNKPGKLPSILECWRKCFESVERKATKKGAIVKIVSLMLHLLKISFYKSIKNQSIIKIACDSYWDY